jgi:methyltransferase (TIGR00027 family)
MKPVSTTAFYCCGIRMMDAQRRRPVCNDIYAEKFMDERGMAILRQFSGERAPNIGNVARHRFIDDWLRWKIAANPRQRVVLIGAGFDSRAFRLEGGRWAEFDEPALIEYKDTRLPVQQCRNDLQRIAIDFAADSLAEKLAPFTGDSAVIFIIEGVTMYLPESALQATLQTLKQLFPRHEIIADLMTRRFIDTIGRSTKHIITSMGAHLIPPDNPALPFQQAGYRQVLIEPVIALGLRYHGLGLLAKLANRIMPATLQGYSVRVFET